MTESLTASQEPPGASPADPAAPLPAEATAAPQAAAEMLVRATINLPGLRTGETALVDPAEPYVADCLAAQYVIPVE